MEELKKRDALIRQIASGDKTLGTEEFDYEIFALNMRKILELMAFSALIAAKKDYSEKYPTYHQHYRAKDILKDLSKIHPHFFPVPAEIVDETEGVRRLTQSTTVNDSLTIEEFKELYDNCSKVIHAWKPYSSEEKKVDFRLGPIEWLNKIRNLLNTHYVMLSNGQNYWLCVMADAQDSRVHVYTLAPAEPTQ